MTSPACAAPPSFLASVVEAGSALQGRSDSRHELHREMGSHPLPFLASVVKAGSALRGRSDRRHELRRDVWSYSAFMMRYREWVRPHLHYTCDWWASGWGPNGRGVGIEAKHWVSLKATREAKRWSMENAAYNARLHMARHDAVLQERRARRKGRH